MSASKASVLASIQVILAIFPLLAFACAQHTCEACHLELLYLRQGLHKLILELLDVRLLADDQVVQSVHCSVSDSKLDRLSMQSLFEIAHFFAA